MKKKGVNKEKRKRKKEERKRTDDIEHKHLI
jgi:hypothetical protein